MAGDVFDRPTQAILCKVTADDAAGSRNRQAFAKSSLITDDLAGISPVLSRRFRRRFSQGCQGR
jgi:hypothetical protein